MEVPTTLPGNSPRLVSDPPRGRVNLCSICGALTARGRPPFVAQGLRGGRTAASEQDDLDQTMGKLCELHGILSE